ncbi:glycosyltransferase family 4 protein [Zunongwangia sp. H14]|uniref:glycosyltransferase family 4 protein n=1 Tax=Zunongwangia sp. H14 TaxID=3240792 RepID=UPI00356968AE
MKKILFISHESSRTGAPFMLLYFLQWLKEKHPEIHFVLLSLYNGGLSKEFKEVAYEYYDFSRITNTKPTFIQRWQRKVFRKLEINYHHRDAKKDFIDDLSRRDFNIIYSNTTVSLSLAQRIKLKKNKSKLILHVHELESEIKRTIGDFRPYVDNIDFVIAASEMVKDNLIVNHQVPAHKIQVVYEFTKKPETSDKLKKNKKVFKVGGSGKFGHRKGTDLFIQVARYLEDNYSEFDIEFTWVGLVPEADKESLDLELEKLGLKNDIHFVGEVEKPESYFEDFDVFLMTSREDPFPLVCIEAGMLGIPIICFDKATGISEIIENKGGFIVPYLNIEAMAERIKFYFNNPIKRVEHSNFNRKEFAKFTACQKGTEILKILERL